MDFLKGHPTRWELCRPFLRNPVLLAQCVGTAYRHALGTLGNDTVQAIHGGERLLRDLVAPRYYPRSSTSVSAGTVTVHQYEPSKTAVVWIWETLPFALAPGTSPRMAAAKFELDLGSGRRVSLIGGPRGRARKDRPPPGDRPAATLKLAAGTVATWRAQDGTLGAAVAGSTTQFATLPDCLIVTLQSSLTY